MQQGALPGVLVPEQQEAGHRHPCWCREQALGAGIHLEHLLVVPVRVSVLAPLRVAVAVLLARQAALFVLQPVRRELHALPETKMSVRF